MKYPVVCFTIGLLLSQSILSLVAQAFPLKDSKPQSSQSLVIQNSTSNNSKENGTGFSRDSRPGRQTSGDTRGYCVTASSPVLSALVPDSNLGRTTSPNPTLWFFVPDTPEAAVKGYFTLQDQDGNDVIDQIEFSFPGQAGYVSVSLSDDVTLSENVEYQWAFELECNPSEPTIYVQGWVKRVPLTADLENQLAAAESEQYEVFTENYIWFDAIDALANRRMMEPNNSALIEDWNNLLEQGGGNLGDLPEQPFLGKITQLP